MIRKGIMHYKPPTVHKLQSGLWHISFKCADQSGKMREVRKTLGMNKIRNLKERELYAKELCVELNKALKNGWNYFAEPEPIAEEKPVTISEGFSVALEYVECTLAKSSFRSYRSTARIFSKFVGENLKLNDLSKKHIYDFVKYRAKSGIENKTINKNMEFLRSMFKQMRKEDLLKSNPLENFESLRVKIKNKKVMNEREVIECFNLLKSVPNYRTFCLFIFYAGIRPMHLAKTQRWQLDFKNNLILTSADNNKNLKDGVKQLPGSLKKELLRLGIDKLGKNMYLFGADFTPSKTVSEYQHVRGREEWARTVQPVFGNEFKQYGLKYSFAEIMKSRKVNPYWMQQHFEHGSLEQTQIYMRSGQVMRIPDSDIPNILQPQM